MRHTPILMAIVAGAFAPAVHARPAQATGIAVATVVRPLSVAAIADMDFGTVTHLPGASGTVTVSPSVSGASYAGGASAVCSGATCDQAHPARFAVSGEPQRHYVIHLPASVVATGSATTPGEIAPPLTISGLTLNSAGGGANPLLDAAGKDQFDVGGTITLPPDLPAAHYHASFAVMVSYS